VIDGAYHARILAVAEARSAFALINLHHPEVTLEVWRDFVRRASRRPRHCGGLVAISDRRGYVHAVFAYHVNNDLRSGTALRVSDVVMGRLPGGTLPKAIIACVESLARELRTGCIQVDFIENALAPADRDALRLAGFSSSGILFSRAGQAS